MHRFQPTRASPPIRTHVLDTSTATDLTQSVSGRVAPELQHLSAVDIDILDAVIKRAGPSATTFFTIFKAYSDILNERGLDPQEVVYYGKLLKLGTLKGKNWGEKWDTVKAQAVKALPATPTLGSFQTETGYHPYPPSESRLSDDQYSSVSQLQAPSRYPTQHTRKAETSRPIPIPASQKPSQEKERKAPSHKKFSLDAKEFPILSSIAKRSSALKYSPPAPTSDDEAAICSPVPPSYKSTVYDLTVPTPPHRVARPPPTIPLTPPSSIGPTRPLPPVSKDKAKVVDLDDAWKNVKMEQDQKIADQFREDMLLARCWEMWRQGFLWITITHKQIGEARDKLLLRLYLQRWRNRVLAQHAREDELVKLFDIHRTRVFWRAWQAKLKHRRQIAWRNDMRQKLKIMKSKTDTRIIGDAWKKWRQLHLGCNADSFYHSTLLLRYLSLWRNKVLQIDDMALLADQFSERMKFANRTRSWITWKNMTGMRRDERMMVDKVNGRIMASTMSSWRKRMEIMKVADNFRDQMIMKHSVQRWKKSVGILSVLENRATKHIHRQDESLLRAIIRIWRARMRGKRLEQLKTVLLVKNAWRSWKAKIEAHAAKLHLATKFAQQCDVRLTTTTLARWHQILTTHRNAHEYAIEVHATHLRSRALLLWRLRLRDNHQSAKVARWANRFFTTRKAWKTWVSALEEKKRQERLKQWEAKKSCKIFNVWRHRAQKGQYFRQCEAVVQDGVKRRIISNTLNLWTNRVIEIKSRELDVVHRHDTALMKSAFVKWKASYQQKIEAVSLLENYLLVKQEDILRRAFIRWLAVKRAAESRRVNHQKKEAQLRQLAITSAWERWRERFKEERLRPLEYELILANQRNIQSWAFTIWLSKTYSLPAVRFHSKHVKQAFFLRWRNAMPNVLRMKKARETDRYNTIVRTFERWSQVYKTKITLKAVARAKSLRLPPTSPRQILTKSRPLYSGSQGIYSRVPQSVEDDEESQVEDPLPDPIRPSARIPFRNIRPRSERSVPRSEYAQSTDQQNDIVVDPPRRSFLPRAEFIKPKPRSERSVPRSDYGMTGVRQPSPVRSIASMPDRNSKPPQSASSSRGVTPQPVARAVVERGSLWTAIADLPKRRSRNL